MEDGCCVGEALPLTAMITVELINIGLGTLSKASMSSGLSQYVYIVYYDALAVFILLPCFIYRCLSGKTHRLSFSLLWKIFGLSLIGKCGFPICYYTGLGFSTVTVAAAISNMCPVFTYMLAICFRMEKPDLKNIVDQLKLMGTIVAVLGALVVTFYKGPVLLSHESSNTTYQLHSGQFCFHVRAFKSWPKKKCGFPICYYTGLGFSTVTVAAAISNMCPVFTYMLAICFRMEKPDLKNIVDQLKLMGTIVAVLGALVVTFYKGPVLLSHESSNTTYQLHSGQSNWPLGVFILTIGFLLKSLWSIAQTNTVKSYQDEVSIIFFYTLFGTIQTAIASFFSVEGPSSWKINHKIEIIAIVYSAFTVSVFTLLVLTWCLKKKGPVYVCMFTPLSIAMAAIAGFVFLEDDIYLGSVIGSATIVLGFYAVMWGQAKTTFTRVISNSDLENASSRGTPLLHS